MYFIPLDLQGAYPRYEIHTSVFAVYWLRLLSMLPVYVINSWQWVFEQHYTHLPHLCSPSTPHAPLTHPVTTTHHNHSSHHLSPPSSFLYPSPQPLTPPPSHCSTTPPLNPFTLHPSSCTGPQEQSREAGRSPLCPGHGNSPEPRKTWLDIVWLHYHPTVDQNSQVGIPPVASQVKCFLYPPCLGDLPL